MGVLGAGVAALQGNSALAGGLALLVVNMRQIPSELTAATISGGNIADAGAVNRPLLGLLSQQGLRICYVFLFLS